MLWGWIYVSFCSEGAGQGRAGIVIQIDVITAEQEQSSRGGLHTAEDHRSLGTRLELSKQGHRSLPTSWISFLHWKKWPGGWEHLPFPWALNVSDNLFNQEKHLVARDRAQWRACGGKRSQVQSPALQKQRERWEWRKEEWWRNEGREGVNGDWTFISWPPRLE